MLTLAKLPLLPRAVKKNGANPHPDELAVLAAVIQVLAANPPGDAGFFFFEPAALSAVPLHTQAGCEGLS